ncbi:hypothetical protein ACP70R_037267 [Stipagrostis hirtigluma subsp. patula]
MAGSKAAAVLLVAVAALLAAASAATAPAANDDHMYHWRCFKSCTNTKCQEEDAAANDGVSVAVPGGGAGAGGQCKKGCMDECFVLDLPGICYQECVVSTCLCLPPYSKEKMDCLKKCCDKCFHHGPVPGPPGPAPKPPKPKPSPPKPTPPKPKPKPSPPKPKPSPPKPKPSPPSPKRPPCPPGGSDNNSTDGSVLV